MLEGIVFFPFFFLRTYTLEDEVAIHFFLLFSFLAFVFVDDLDLVASVWLCCMHTLHYRTDHCVCHQKTSSSIEVSFSLQLGTASDT
jgi:hypothetical protein